ncbi:UvrD-helicase domain-containing protein [Flavihumibacter petaseus]|uniref:DNA 3'-5' helicase n=1 Tax=Flavihumibacter petaseus NBRC 106054 TaxID=1220578 RepID=A0A0E9MXW6_9BACT|nr:UvrD-helicase domain-containing protein [Flavihumibacter petaseus]GAO42276.1 putative ATP-dependent DNA helicase [Flavihumibacter petaseus NBRC 106054]
MLSKPLHIYRASAGSGKTFLLASQYLRLLFTQPQKFREILAVTFTNKATEEMKERILGELEKIAEGKPTPYRAIIQAASPRLQGDQLDLAAQRIYRSILHDYSRFSVGTIDSFVQQVIRAFAFEIGLDSGYALELNSELVKTDLAERLFRLLDTDSALRSWITDLVYDRLADGQSWDFRQAMLQLADEIFKERFAFFEDNMRALEDPDKSFQQLRNNLVQRIQPFEGKLLLLASQALECIQSASLEPDDFRNGKRGFTANLLKIHERREFGATDKLRKAAGNINEWITKSMDTEKKSAIEQLFPQLDPLLQQMIEFYDANRVDYYTALSVYRNLYNLNLLRVLAAQLANYRRENRVLLIGDTHLLLRELVRENDTPFIFEKTGSRYQHFLIDEFQDTSTIQWENFRPLLEQTIATGQYNLLVGDVKQAIYRWRNGDWRLLLKTVKEQLGDAVVEEGRLQDNYRSRKEIISFNNYIFREAPLLLQQQFNQEMAEIPDQNIFSKLESEGYFSMISDAYADSNQDMPAGVRGGGSIELELFERPEPRSSRSWWESAAGVLPVTIERLIREEQYSPGGIAILTRNNQDARTVIDELLHYQDAAPDHLRYPIVSADALLINNAPIVQLLVAAISCLNDPSDQVSRATLVQANAIRLKQQLDDPVLYSASKETAFAQLPDHFSNRFENLRRMSLYDCVEALIVIFSLDTWEAEQPYLLHFRDLINAFANKGKTTLKSFVSWWADEGDRQALPAAGGGNAVQVMTIHKSKGLAFDAVILPFADWEFKSEKGNIWCALDPAIAGITWVPVKLSQQLRETAFAFDYFEETLFNLMDALNLLYVALTRARKKLVMFGPMPSKSTLENDTVKTVADLMYQLLHPAANKPVAAEWQQFWQATRFHLHGEATSETIHSEHREQPARLPASSRRQQPSWLRAAEKDRPQATTSTQQEWGSLLHLALSRIDSKQQIDQQLQRLLLEGKLLGSQLPELRSGIMEVLNVPELAQWYSGGYEAMSERPILLQGGAVRRPDKIFIGKEETILVDFKFTQSLQPSHAAQLQQYRQLLEQMGYRNVKAYLYYGQQQQLVPLASLPGRQGNLFN